MQETTLLQQPQQVLHIPPHKHVQTIQEQHKQKLRQLRLKQFHLQQIILPVLKHPKFEEFFKNTEFHKTPSDDHQEKLSSTREMMNVEPSRSHQEMVIDDANVENNSTRRINEIPTYSAMAINSQDVLTFSQDNVLNKNKFSESSIFSDLTEELQRIAFWNVIHKHQNPLTTDDDSEKKSSGDLKTDPGSIVDAAQAVVKSLATVLDIQQNPLLMEKPLQNSSDPLLLSENINDLPFSNDDSLSSKHGIIYSHWDGNYIKVLENVLQQRLDKDRRSLLTDMEPFPSTTHNSDDISIPFVRTQLENNLSNKYLILREAITDADTIEVSSTKELQINGSPKNSSEKSSYDPYVHVLSTKSYEDECNTTTNRSVDVELQDINESSPIYTNISASEERSLLSKESVTLQKCDKSSYEVLQEMQCEKLADEDEIIAITKYLSSYPEHERFLNQFVIKFYQDQHNKQNSQTRTDTNMQEIMELDSKSHTHKPLDCSTLPSGQEMLKKYEPTVLSRDEIQEVYENSFVTVQESKFNHTLIQNEVNMCRPLEFINASSNFSASVENEDQYSESLRSIPDIKLESFIIDNCTENLDQFPIFTTEPKSYDSSLDGNQIVIKSRAVVSSMDTVDKSSAVVSSLDTVDRRSAVVSNMDTVDKSSAVVSSVDTVDRSSAVVSNMDTVDKSSAVVSSLDTVDRRSAAVSNMDTVDKKFELSEESAILNSLDRFLSKCTTINDLNTLESPESSLETNYIISAHEHRDLLLPDDTNVNCLPTTYNVKYQLLQYLTHLSHCDQLTNELQETEEINMGKIEPSNSDGILTDNDGMNSILIRSSPMENTFSGGNIIPMEGDDSSDLPSSGKIIPIIDDDSSDLPSTNSLCESMLPANHKFDNVESRTSQLHCKNENKTESLYLTSNVQSVEEFECEINPLSIENQTVATEYEMDQNFENKSSNDELPSIITEATHVKEIFRSDSPDVNGLPQHECGNPNVPFNVEVNIPTFNNYTSVQVSEKINILGPSNELDPVPKLIQILDEIGTMDGHEQECSTRGNRIKTRKLKRYNRKQLVIGRQAKKCTNSIPPLKQIAKKYMLEAKCEEHSESDVESEIFLSSTAYQWNENAAKEKVDFIDRCPVPEDDDSNCHYSDDGENKSISLHKRTTNINDEEHFNVYPNCRIISMIEKKHDYSAKMTYSFEEVQFENGNEDEFKAGLNNYDDIDDGIDFENKNKLITDVPQSPYPNSSSELNTDKLALPSQTFHVTEQFCMTDDCKSQLLELVNLLEPEIPKIDEDVPSQISPEPDKYICGDEASSLPNEAEAVNNVDENECNEKVEIENFKNFYDELLFQRRYLSTLKVVSCIFCSVFSLIRSERGDDSEYYPDFEIEIDNEIRKLDYMVSNFSSFYHSKNTPSNLSLNQKEDEESTENETDHVKSLSLKRCASVDCIPISTKKVKFAPGTQSPRVRNEKRKIFKVKLLSDLSSKILKSFKHNASAGNKLLTKNQKVPSANINNDKIGQISDISTNSNELNEKHVLKEFDGKQQNNTGCVEGGDLTIKVQEEYCDSLKSNTNNEAIEKITISKICSPYEIDLPQTADNFDEVEPTTTASGILSENQMNEIDTVDDANNAAELVSARNIVFINGIAIDENDETFV